MTVTENAINVLQSVMKKRKWYGNKIERRKANVYKNLLSKEKLSYQKASEILVIIGWSKIKEETWNKK